MENRFALFDDRVFSLKPRWNESIGDDLLAWYRNAYSRDEEIYERVLDMHGRPIDYSPGIQDKGLYLFDPAETRIRLSFLKRIGERRIDLAFARKVIVEDRYPVRIEYVRNFKRWTAKRKTSLMLGEYYITFGRMCIVDMIGECRYEPALPELMEIIFHDNEWNMKIAALSALRTFRKKVLVEPLNELLEKNGDPKILRYVLDLMEDRVSDSSFVENLNRKFDEHYSDEYDLALLSYGETIAQKIIKVCAKVPSMEALYLIEKGLGHPLSFIENTARKALHEWVWKVMELKTIEAKEVREIIYKYDLYTHKGIWEALKKRDTLLIKK